MPITEATYKAILLEDPDGQWELHRGRPRTKPTMSFTHNDLMTELGFVLRRQLDRSRFVVRVNSGRLNRLDETYYLPDVFVISHAQAAAAKRASGALESYAGAVPLVVEVWSPSTGDYDVDRKFPEYRARGDLEIWRLHPTDRTLTRWLRRADGGYEEQTQRGGVVQLVHLPGVMVDLDELYTGTVDL